jgi:hypothetical protein
VIKVQHKPIKISKLGFKRKEQKKPKRTLVWRTGLSDVLPKSVWCPRDRTGWTLHLRVSRESLRYNSSDCPVCQAEQFSPAQRSTSTVGWQREQCADSSRRVRAAPEGTSDSEQCLSGATPDCSVYQDVRAPTVKTVSTLTVGRRGWRTGHCPVAHRTVRCAPRQQPTPMAILVVWAINTPNHHYSRHPSFSDISFNTRASAINTRHNSIESKPLQVSNPLQTNSD